MDFRNRGVRLGDLLVSKGLIRQEDLDEALKIQAREGIRLGEALTGSGIVTEDDIGWALADQYDVPYLHLGSAVLDPEAVHLIPEDFARRHTVIPIILCGDELSVAIDDPLKNTVLDDVRTITGLTLNVALSLESQIQKALDEVYGQDPGWVDLKAPEFFIPSLTEETLQEVAQDLSGEALIRLIVREAAREHASMIYMEPTEDGTRVRFRVGGTVHVRVRAGRGWHCLLMTRLRMMAGLSATSHFEPCSTDMRFDAGSEIMELHLSLCPTSSGETAAIRLRNRRRPPTLAELGFDGSQLTALRSILAHQFGLIVVTGSTEQDIMVTLYALLGEIDTANLKVVTIDDGLTSVSDSFTQLVDDREERLPALVNAAMLMEPDVLMVDGIRDVRLPGKLVEAALAGHFVLLSQPFESAQAFIDHLLSLHRERDIIATKLAVIGQRTIKTLCLNCREACEPDASGQSGVVYRAMGCEACSHTGYSGKRSIFEMIVFTDEIKEVFRRGQGIEEMGELLERYGFKSLKERAEELLREGVTSLEQVSLIP